MKKSIAIFVLALLLLPAFSMAVPVRASTGHPVLAATDGTNIVFAQSYVEMQAGSDVVYSVDGDTTYSGWNLMIVYDINGSPTTWFSGAQFNLWFAKQGFSVLNATDGDFEYATNFLVSDLNAPGGTTVGDYTLGTWTLTNVDDSTAVTVKGQLGPVPGADTPVTAAHHFVKVYDGDVTLVAVATQQINLLPSFKLVPDYGPPCTDVTLYGVALQPNAWYQVNYTNPVTGRAVSGYSDEYGRLELSWSMVDLGKYGYVYDDYSSPVTITMEVFKNITAIPYGFGIVYFNESLRQFDAFYSEYMNRWWSGPFGNTTCGEDSWSVPVYVFDHLWINASGFCPDDQIIIRIGCWGVTGQCPGDNESGENLYIATGVYPSEVNGQWYYIVEVPELAQGCYNVCVENNGVRMTFCMCVYPTLIVVPEEGPCNSQVEFKVYGFPANEDVYIYWYELSLYDFTWYNVVNGTTGDDGKFVAPVTMVVPPQYGGPHPITAGVYGYDGSTYLGPSYPSYSFANTSFTVTPSFWLDTTEICNTCTPFYLYGCGLIPFTPYTIDVDNQAFNPPFVLAGADGQLTVQMIASGFRPGSHVISMYLYPIDPYNLSVTYIGNYETLAYICFNVCTDGDPIYGMLVQISNEMSNQTATIVTQFGVINAALADLDAMITNINGNVVTIWTTLGTLTTTVNAINTKVVAIQGDVATILTDVGVIKGKVTAMEGTVATISTDVGTVKADVSAVKTDVNTIKGYLPVDMTPVWITLIVALIAAIAAIYAVISIRSKIAA